MQYDSYQHIHIHTPCMVLYSREYDMHTRAYMNYVCIILSIHCTVHTCLYSSYSVHCTPRIVCIREYYELVCILLASTLEYGMHTTTLVVIPTYYSYYAYQLVVRGRSVHCIHTTSEEYILQICIGVLLECYSSRVCITLEQYAYYESQRRSQLTINDTTFVSYQQSSIILRVV